MSEQSYVEGFMAKCAEFGVDPEAVVKAAQEVDHDVASDGVEAPSPWKSYGSQVAHGLGSSYGTMNALQRGLPVRGTGRAMRILREGADTLPEPMSRLAGKMPTFGKMISKLPFGARLAAGAGNAVLDATGPVAGALGAASGAKPGNRLREAGRGWAAGADSAISGAVGGALGRRSGRRSGGSDTAPGKYDAKKRQTQARTNKAYNTSENPAKDK